MGLCTAPIWATPGPHRERKMLDLRPRGPSCNQVPPHGGNEHTARHISSFKLLKHSLHPSSNSKDVEHHPCNVCENEVYEIPVAGCDMKERETEPMYITLHFGQHQIRGLVDTGW